MDIWNVHNRNDFQMKAFDAAIWLVDRVDQSNSVLSENWKANTEIENQLPYNEYYDFFGPDYELVPNIINNRVRFSKAFSSNDP